MLILSIHVDGYYGLVKGVPKILDLLDKYNLKATFFVNMGREATIFDLLKYRSKKLKKIDNKIVKRYSKNQLIKIVLSSRKLGHGNCKILREIIKKGHELNPHSWSHLKWSKDKKVDFEKEIKKMKKSFFKCTGKYPLGFAPPTWKINDTILKILKKEGFEYIEIDKGSVKKDGILLIPLSFPKNIEELLNEGKSREEILEIYKKEINKKYSHLYFHADFEGFKGLKIFEEVLSMIKNKKTYTCYEASKLRI